MSDKLQAAISELDTVMSGLTGIARWYGDPPPSISEFPSGFVRIGEGEMHHDAAGGAGMHELVIEILESKSVTPQVANSIQVWPHRVYEVLSANNTLNGSIAHMVWPLKYSARVVRYGADTFFAIRFFLTIKIRGA